MSDPPSRRPAAILALDGTPVDTDRHHALRRAGVATFSVLTGGFSGRERRRARAACAARARRALLDDLGATPFGPA